MGPVVCRILFLSGALVLGTGALMPAEGATHTVRKGDTLYAISRNYKVSVNRLMAANGIKDPTKLRIGRKLGIPGGSSSSSLKSSVAQVGRGKRVVIDPGHGGRDWGAYRGGVKESYLNLKVAKKLEYELKRRGYSTAMTRRSDHFVSLSRRAALGNRYRNAVFVSIHFNASRYRWVRGAESFYAGRAGRSLALCIQRELVRRCRLRDRGVRFARFTVLTQTRCPAVLVECGFMSNASERRRCVSSSHHSHVAMAIAEGIGKYRWR